MPRSWATHYQCRFQGCASVVTRMSQQLRKKHQITDAQTLKEAKIDFIVIHNLSEASSSSRKEQGGPIRQQPPPQKKTRRVESLTTESSDSSTDETYNPSGDSDMDDESMSKGALRADLDEISIAASSSSEEEKEDESSEAEEWGCTHWANVHSTPARRSVRTKYLHGFYTYLGHAEGGAHHPKQHL